MVRLCCMHARAFPTVFARHCSWRNLSGWFLYISFHWPMASHAKIHRGCSCIRASFLVSRARSLGFGLWTDSCVQQPGLYMVRMVMTYRVGDLEVAFNLHRCCACFRLLSSTGNTRARRTMSQSICGYPGGVFTGTSYHQIQRIITTYIQATFMVSWCWCCWVPMVGCRGRSLVDGRPAPSELKPGSFRSFGCNSPPSQVTASSVWTRQPPKAQLCPRFANDLGPEPRFSRKVLFWVVISCRRLCSGVASLAEFMMQR